MAVEPKKLARSAAWLIAMATATAALAGADDTRLAGRPSVSEWRIPESANPLPSQEVALLSSSPTVRLVVGVSWEGRDLHPFNLDALAAARDAHPEIPYTHFLSPAYFLRAGQHSATARATIASALRPGDRIGVELGGWRSLAEAAGVIYRATPNFWGTVPRECAEADCGGDVPLNVYPAADAAKLAATAVETIAANGFPRPASARVSGWVASTHVLEALAAQGVRYDFSAVPPELLAARLRAFPVHDWVRTLWHGITPHAQPFLPPKLTDPITEVPQNVASLEYTSEADAITIFKELLETARKDPSRELTFQLTAYQETARMTAPRLARVVGKMKELAAASGVALVPFESGIPWARDAVAH